MRSFRMFFGLFAAAVLMLGLLFSAPAPASAQIIDAAACASVGLPADCNPNSEAFIEACASLGVGVPRPPLCPAGGGGDNGGGDNGGGDNGGGGGNPPVVDVGVCAEVGLGADCDGNGDGIIDACVGIGVGQTSPACPTGGTGGGGNGGGGNGGGGTGGEGGSGNGGSGNGGGGNGGGGNGGGAGSGGGSGSGGDDGGDDGSGDGSGSGNGGSGSSSGSGSGSSAGGGNGGGGGVTIAALPNTGSGPIAAELGGSWLSPVLVALAAITLVVAGTLLRREYAR